MLDDLPIGDPPDVDLVPGRMLAGRRHAREVALHRAARRQPMHDLVARFDRIVDGVVQIREGGPVGHHELLETFARRRDARLRVVLDKIRRVNLVDEVVVSLVEDLERNALELHLQICTHQQPFRVRLQLPRRWSSWRRLVARTGV